MIVTLEKLCRPRFPSASNSWSICIIHYHLSPGPLCIKVNYLLVAPWPVVDHRTNLERSSPALLVLGLPFISCSHYQTCTKRDRSLTPFVRNVSPLQWLQQNGKHGGDTNRNPFIQLMTGQRILLRCQSVSRV